MQEKIHESVREKQSEYTHRNQRWFKILRERLTGKLSEEELFRTCS